MIMKRIIVPDFGYELAHHNLGLQRASNNCKRKHINRDADTNRCTFSRSNSDTSADAKTI